MIAFQLTLPFKQIALADYISIETVFRRFTGKKICVLFVRQATRGVELLTNHNRMLYLMR